MPSRWQRFSIRCGFGGCEQVCAATLIFGVLLQAVNSPSSTHTTAITKAKTIGFQYLTTPIISHAPASLDNYQSNAEALRLRRSFSTRKLSAT